MPFRSVTVLHDVTELKSYLGAVLQPYVDFIHNTGCTIDDYLNWVIIHELENITFFNIINHNRGLVNHNKFYNVIINALSKHAVTRAVSYSISLPFYFSKNNEVSIRFTEHDIIAVFEVEYFKNLTTHKVNS